MSAAEDLCRELGLRPPSYWPGRYYTTCPRCSTRRQRVHQNLKCLGITIEPDGVHAGCNHCGWTAGQRAHGLRHHHRPARPRPTPKAPSPPPVVGGPEQQLGKTRWLWRMAAPARGTPAETYLRSRGIEVPPPATIRFLRPRKPGHHPAMVVAFGLPIEPEPGVLDIADDAVRGVQLTLLRPDGSGKAKAIPNKLTIGTCSGVPMVLAAPNDLLGLAVAEGAEEALTVHQLTGLGVWASGGAFRLPALADTVPDHIDTVRVMVDADDAGRRGAHELARRLLARNFHVELIAAD